MESRPIPSLADRLKCRGPRASTIRKSVLAVGIAAIALVTGLIGAPSASAATGDFVIQGRGYGHGVGLSQWGAWQGARDGYLYDQILAFYYPGSTLTDVSAGTTIRVRISKDPTTSTDPDSFYRVYMKAVGTTATLVVKKSGVADVTVPIAVGQIVETHYMTDGGVGRVYTPGGISSGYDQVFMIPDAGTGRVAVSLQTTSSATATSYREYRGQMNVEPMSGGAMYLYNHVLLDDYTRGVAEIMPEWAKPSWPQYYAIEAVKAQAVAARTYAYVDYIYTGYVNDDTRDICYKGYDYEVSNPGAAQAAADTNGKVLKYGSSWYKTYFSAHSGGYTSATAWSDNPPWYVVSQPDPWSLAAPTGHPSIQPGYPWTVTISPSLLATKLVGPGYIDDVGTITKVEVISRDTSDSGSHATYLRVTGTGGSDTMSARSFRSALGLRSTLFNVTVDGASNRADDDDPNITYLGDWSRSPASSAYGGNLISVNSPGRLHVGFQGTYLALVTKTAPYYGIAKVTLDDNEPVMVDFYSTTVRYQQVIYNTGNLADGEHRLTMEWTGEKNPASWASLVGVDAFEVEGALIPSPDRPPRYEEDDPNFSYGGPWDLSSVAEASGGSQQTLNYPGSVTVSFDGTYLAWIGKTASYYGKAKVTLDNETTTIVDLYSPSAVYQKKLYDTGLLTPGPHTVTVEWTGTKNPASYYYQIAVDAFDVIGTLTPSPDPPPRYEEDDSNFSYGGPWDLSSVAEASGGSQQTLNYPGSVTVSFDGTYLAWIGKTASYYGKAKVTLDNETTTIVDLYSPSAVYQKKLYDTGLLTPGPHTVTVEWTGTKNPASYYYQIAVDAFDVIGTLTQAPPAPEYPNRYEQSDTAITYLGQWSTAESSLASGGSLTYAFPGGEALVCFDGTSLTWLAATGIWYGRARVSLDGEPAEVVDLYSPSTLFGQEVYSTGTLSEGEHTLLIEPDGSRDPSALTDAINIDAFEVFGQLVDAPKPSRLQQTDSRLAYSGSWVNSYSWSASGGNFYFLNSPGSVTVEFDGTYLAWITKKSSVYGKAWVRLDGGVPELVDLYSSTTQWRIPVWSTGILSPGSHTVCISWSGLKSSSASSYNIGIDAFDILGTPVASPQTPEMPTRYENSDWRLSYEGEWSTRWWSTASGGTYYLLDSAGSVTVRFTGTYLSWVAKQGPPYGIATVSVDDGPPVSVDLYQWTDLLQQNVYNTGILPLATHSVVISWTGEKNSSSSGYNIDIDALDVIGTLVQ